MKYDFTTVLDRVGNDAIAVEFPTSPRGFQPEGTKDGYSVIPMWVADMNFMTAPSIVEAIQKRAAHASFGYFSPRPEYYDAIISWQKRRFGIDITKELIGYENGVLGALSSALSAFTEPGEKIFLHGPTYIGFLHTLSDMGRETSISELVRDENGISRMDYEDIEKHFVEDNIRFAVLCSPHNPAGRVWERWELEKFVELCVKHNVILFSDEIWCDLVLEGKHIPTNAVSEDARKITIAAYAPTKTFSLAGLVGSYHVIFNEELRKKVEKAASMTHYNGMNVLSQHALIGAYSKEGEEWLEELLEVLRGNVDFACNYLKEHCPSIKFDRPQGTYMLFLDCSDFLKEINMDIKSLLKYGWERGVIWQDGQPFGKKDSIRVNLCLPLWQIQEAVKRLEKE